MLKAALTIGYALAVLLGPGVCCCSWVTPKAHAAPQKAPAPKRAKACCAAPATNTCETHPAGKTPAGDPTKCPCKQHKPVVDSSPGVATPFDASAAHRLGDWVAFTVVDWPDLSALDSSVAPASPPRVYPPGGRALLSAYHILRC